MRRSVNRFNQDEDEVIRQSSHLSAATIAQHLGRHQASIISRQITLGLRIKNRTIRPFSEIEDGKIAASVGKVSLYDLAVELGRKPSSVYGRAKRLGLDFNPALRQANRRLKGGYWWVPIAVEGKRTWVQEHRHLMAKHIGCQLSHREQVHHIDFDKQNNSLDNLYLCASGRRHRAIHNSLEKMLGSAAVIRQLLVAGRLSFDRSNGQYNFRAFA